MVSNKLRLEGKGKPVEKSRKNIILPCKKEIEKDGRCLSKAPPLEACCKHTNTNLQCHTLSEEEVESFYKRFCFTRDRELQDTFILRHCEARSPRLRGGGVSKRRRNISALYFVSTRERKVRVCRAAFAGILRVKGYRINHLLKLFKENAGARFHSTDECDSTISEPACEKPKKKVTFALSDHSSNITCDTASTFSDKSIAAADLNSNIHDRLNTVLKDFHEIDFLNSAELLDIPENIIKEICKVDNLTGDGKKELTIDIDNILSLDSLTLQNIHENNPGNQNSPNKSTKMKHVSSEENLENDRKVNLSTIEESPVLIQESTLSDENKMPTEEKSASFPDNITSYFSEQDDTTKCTISINGSEKSITTENVHSKIPTFVPICSKQTYDKCNLKGKGVDNKTKKSKGECFGKKTISHPAKKEALTLPKTAPAANIRKQSEQNSKENKKNKIPSKEDKAKPVFKREIDRIGLVKNANTSSAVNNKSYNFKTHDFQNACDKANDSFEAFLDAIFPDCPFDVSSDLSAIIPTLPFEDKYHNLDFLGKCSEKQLSTNSVKNNIGKALEYEWGVRKSGTKCLQESSKTFGINNKTLQNLTDAKSTPSNDNKDIEKDSELRKICIEIKDNSPSKTSSSSDHNKGLAIQNLRSIKMSHDNLLNQLKDESGSILSKSEGTNKKINNFVVSSSHIKKIEMSKREDTHTTKADRNRVLQRQNGESNVRAVKAVDTNTSPLLATSSIKKASAETNTDNRRPRNFTWSTPRIKPIPRTKTDLKNKNISKCIQFGETGRKADSDSNPSSEDVVFKNPGSLVRKEQPGCRAFRSEARQNHSSQNFDSISIFQDKITVESDDKENIKTSLCTDKNSFLDSNVDVMQTSITPSFKKVGRLRSRLGRRNLEKNEPVSNNLGKPLLDRIPLQTLQIDFC